MTDIAQELRERSLRAEQEGEPMALLDEAADEIERLRRQVSSQQNFTLTDEERDVLHGVAEDASYRCADFTERVVRGLLERTK
jgi:hypothetical protein